LPKRGTARRGSGTAIERDHSSFRLKEEEGPEGDEEEERVEGGEWRGRKRKREE
jgi:hypothetical protein